jgi:hypothetical protein
MNNAGELRLPGQPRRLSLRSQFLPGPDVLIFIAAQFLLSRSIAGHRELENGTMVRTTAGPRLDPDLPAFVLNHLLTDCQTNSVARVFGPGVEALEDDNNILRVFRCNADPVVAHAEQLLLARFLGLHGNRRRLEE